MYGSHEALRAIILFLDNFPSDTPGLKFYALEVFKGLNKDAFDLLAKLCPDMRSEIQNLRVATGEFSKQSTIKANELRNTRFPTCTVVMQPTAIMDPSSKSHQALLCSYFDTGKPAVILLEPGSPLKMN